MTGYNLPDGCTDKMIDRYWGGEEKEFFELYLWGEGGWMLQDEYEEEDDAIHDGEYFVKHGQSAKVKDSDGRKIWERAA